MLTLYHNSQEIVLDTTEYYVRELASGLDEIIFDLSIWDPNYALIAEEANIIDRGGQRYLVKQIDAGAVMAKIVCQLDLDDWKASLAVGYDSGSKTVAQQVSAVCPAGWSVLDRSGSSISRTIHGDYTPLQVCEACRDIYSVYIRWDTALKRCTIYPQAMGSPAGSFATRELNLKEINYKGKSQNFITRLYAYGKEGLSFADINGGKPYVDDNSYSNRIICGYWQDDRYTVKQNLLDDAREKLAKLAVPERSYDCAVVDLQATNPSMYGNLSFELFTVATLIDDSRNTAIDYQVVERHVWPYHPDRNDVIFNSSPVKIQNSVVQIEDEIINPNSTFSQIWANRVQEATDWLTSGDGYVVAVQDASGNWKETLYMDTPDMATAQKVLRMNENGIGFSTTGVNGPYTSAWTIDGSFNADFIQTGSLTANLIKAGVLTDLAGKFSLNMETGALTMASGTFSGEVISQKDYTVQTTTGTTFTETRRATVDAGEILIAAKSQYTSNVFEDLAKFSIAGYAHATPRAIIAHPACNDACGLWPEADSIILGDGRGVVYSGDQFGGRISANKNGRVYITADNGEGVYLGCGGGDLHLAVGNSYTTCYTGNISIGGTTIQVHNGLITGVS